MSIGYKDFFPAALKHGIFSTEYEALTATVARANAWLDASGVLVINVETVLLPNVSDGAKAAQTPLRTSGEMGSYWHQVVRVWYKLPE